MKGSANWRAMLEGLRERGYVSGQNLIVECRYSEGQQERALALAMELVSLKVDLLVAFGTQGVSAAKQATSTIPIVMVGVIDPVGKGLVASLARPGGNVTGPATDAGLQIVGKWLQVLKDALPPVSRVAVLEYGDGPAEDIFTADLKAAARALHVTLHHYRIRALDDVEGAFNAMTRARAEALLVLPHPFIFTHAQRIVDLAAQNKLPAVYPDRKFVDAGGLLAYGVDEPATWRRVGFYADKIFKGARPADLPVEQPNHFELIINLKAARALGLTIPQSLRARADDVIQ